MSDYLERIRARVDQNLDNELQALRTERLATRKLLRKIREILAHDCAIEEAELINEIDDLLGVE